MSFKLMLNINSLKVEIQIFLMLNFYFLTEDFFFVLSVENIENEIQNEEQEEESVVDNGNLVCMKVEEIVL